MTSPLPILPTTVIGSYSMPEWLERAKNEYLSRRLSRRDLDEMHDAVRKAAIKDQEIAGIDIVSDGEAQRDNMIDYFTERMPGVQVDLGSKRFYYDFYDSVVRSKLATGHARARRKKRDSSDVSPSTSRRFRSPGPHTLVKRIQNKFYPTGRGVRARSRTRAEPGAEGAGARRRHRPADRRAVLFGVPRRSAVGAQGDQRDGRRRQRARHAAHLLRQSLRQAVVRGQLPVSVPGDSRREGARGLDGVRAPRRGGSRSCSRSSTCRSRSASASSTSRPTRSNRRRFVADRIRRALEVIPAERLVITPDCGLRAPASRCRVQQAECDGRRHADGAKGTR